MENIIHLPVRHTEATHEAGSHQEKYCSKSNCYEMLKKMRSWHGKCIAKTNQALQTEREYEIVKSKQRNESNATQ